MYLYFCSLKQSGVQTGNPWPPYKERTPLHPCYRGLVRLLHCKTLHIVIFTLLYKVSRWIKILWWRCECFIGSLMSVHHHRFINTSTIKGMFSLDRSSIRFQIKSSRLWKWLRKVVLCFCVCIDLDGSSEYVWACVVYGAVPYRARTW